MYILLLCFSCFLAVSTHAVVAQHQEILVQFRSAQHAKQFFTNKKLSPSYTYKECLSKKLQIHLLESEQEAALLEKLHSHPMVMACQYNPVIQWRSRLTNDPLVGRQWGLDSLGISSVWQETTGGLSPNGDSIVCGVIDGSFDVEHEDLVDNIWHNYAEIPNNGIDDDNNGYIDDFTGWQVVYNTDQHNYGQLRNHGTSILGIIGARGNNNKGVTGINQQIKLLLLSAHTATAITRLSNVIKAYSYLLEMRELYNRSKGQKGAYVVAINTSWGIDFAPAAEHPIWCGLFDQLGKAGILSIAATTNIPIDIDQEGDMPCTCASPYLITVSEHSRAYQATAAYGNKHLDLFSIGENYTTRLDNHYGAFGGTSGAAPHVTGAVALLYSYKNPDWGQLQINQPSEAALLVKQSVLRGSVQHSDLVASVTGGSLHFGHAFQQLKNHFEQPANTGIIRVFPNPVQEILTLELASTPTGLHNGVLYNNLGQIVRQYSFNYDLPSTRLWNIWMGNLSSGAYHLVIRINGQYHKQSIIKIGN